MRSVALLLLAGVALVAGGCGDQTGTAQGANVLRGGILYFGGPAGLAKQGKRYEPGTVKLYRGRDEVATDTVSVDEGFEFRVRPGTYRLLTSLGDTPCERVVEVTGSMVVADLECPIK
jgi:hypothetical protein